MASWRDLRKQQLLDEIQQERQMICDLVEESCFRNQTLPPIPFREMNRIIDMILKDAVQKDDVMSTPPAPSIEERLQAESDLLKADLAAAEEKRKRTMTEMERLLKCIATMEEMRGNAENTTAEGDFSNIQRNLNKRFDYERKKLKYVLEKILTDDKESFMLISELINYALSTHEYLELEDQEGIAERVQFLLNTKFFEKNPDNPLQVRMKKLI